MTESALFFATRHQTVRVLLIDDQRIIGEAVRRMLEGAIDIEYHFVQDPNEAIAKAKTIEPTVILQDLVMPGVDGIELVKQFRTDPLTQWIPLVVLSSKEEAATKAEAFAAGANDYLVKLPDPVELIARIRYHSSAYLAILERQEAYEALEASQQQLAAELSEAADYVRSQFSAPRQTERVTASWLFKPCSSLGGDAFGYFDIDDDHFGLFLLDVCNHGIGCALLSVTAMNALQHQAFIDVDYREPIQVMDALNITFPMEKHNNLYFTIWYGVFQWSSRTLRYSSAGHPPAILLTPENVELLRCSAPPVGSFEGIKFEEAKTRIPERSKLYVYSDGIYEIQMQDGKELEFSTFLDELKKPEATSGQKLNEILATMTRLQGRAHFDDDVSMMELLF
jgi:sigma-B regulation protein RsbU (phosphoserine phosphatase)